MTEALPGMFVLVGSILRVVYQHIRSIYECKKGRVKLFSPFYIGGKDEYPVRVLDAIDHRPIQGMAVRKPGSHTHLRFARNVFSRAHDGRSSSALAPDNQLLFAYCMKRAPRG